MKTYQATPDYYRDVIQHGWLKDQVNKAHKYIKKYMGKNGKWIYVYESKLNEAKTKFNRMLGTENAIGTVQPQHITTNYGKTHLLKSDYGKPTSRMQRHTQKGLRYAQGLAAARQRAEWKKVKSGTGYSGSSSTRGNATSRGYSGSKGSGESTRVRNTATRKYDQGASDKSRKYRIGDAVDRKAIKKVSARKGNLASRGYSSSRDAGVSKRVSNMGTRQSVKSAVNSTSYKGGSAFVSGIRKNKAGERNVWKKDQRKARAIYEVNRGVSRGGSDEYTSNKPYNYSYKGKRGVDLGSYRTLDFVTRANGRNAQKRKEAMAKKVRSGKAYTPSYKKSKKVGNYYSPTYKKRTHRYA